MAKWGSCDYKQLQKLKANLDKLQSTDLDKFCQDVSKELAARLLALVIPRTPVGDYNTYELDGDGNRVIGDDGKAVIKRKASKKGGTLRRGWTAKTSQEAQSGSGKPSKKAGAAYAETLPVTKQGSNYVIEVINPVFYASYVEFGHRTKGGGWVNGQYFLTVSEQELRSIAPGIIERKLQKLLQEVFNV